MSSISSARVVGNHAIRRHLAIDPLDDVGRVVNHLAVPFEHRHPRPRALGHREQVGLVLVMAIDRLPLEMLVRKHAPHLLGKRRDRILVKIYFTHSSDPRDRQLKRDLLANQIPNMASALCDFDQSMHLLVIGTGFNLKFYFNFFQMPFFVGARMHRRPPQLHFAHARSHSKRHQQASAERTQKRRNRIGRRIILSRQPPSQHAVLHLSVQRISHSIDDNLAKMRRFLRLLGNWHVRRSSSPPNLAETATFLQTVRSGDFLPARFFRSEVSLYEIAGG